VYDFILTMWRLRRIDADKVADYVSKGFIDQEQADTILSTPQVPA